MRMLQLLCSF
ncbi:hypothetical protein MTR67_031392 [Solanum verrucosum]|uniref:Uncharacterized protein n=1 Tax=Solanum verrucosum TaxID=315347 RepID=A0AAF0U2G3_SOLVR|nr:hypothetical protein MTR67_031392 [Solanum verrucosum]